MAQPRLSAVVPCYNESGAIPALRAELSALDLFARGELELVLVDDGSRDETWGLLADWARRSPLVTAVRLDGNHGNQLAMVAGILNSRGAAVAVLDADLQDPPGLLEPMLRRLEAGGADSVVGLKTRRQDGSAWLATLKGAATAVFPFRRGEGDFCVMRREAALKAARLGRSHTPFRVRRLWASSRNDYWPYERRPRVEGTSKFRLASLARLWWRMARSLYLEGPGPSDGLQPAVAEVAAGRAA